MEWELHGKVDRGYVARITAGFCWPWSKPRPDGTLVDDVTIGSWRRPWNLASDKALNGIPPSIAVGHRGCRVRAGGMRLHRAGLRVRIRRSHHRRRLRLAWRPLGDSACCELRPGHQAASNSDELIRNVYKVLLTRGLRGCIVYSVDPETQQMLAGLGIPALSHPIVTDTSGHSADSLGDLAADLAGLCQGQGLGAVPHPEEPRHGPGRAKLVNSWRASNG